MIGKYKVYINNKLVSESSNIITTNGKNIIRHYLSGAAPAWAGSIAVGALNKNVPALTDTSLEFEIQRFPIFVKYVDSSEIVCTATLDADLDAKIFELGLYPTTLNSSSKGFDDKVIVNGEEDWTDNSGVILTSSSYYGTETSPQGRVGYRNLVMSTSAQTFKLTSGEDISGYSDSDSITILYDVASTGTNKSLTITFEDDTLPTPKTKYKVITLTSSSTGYNSITSTLGSFTEESGFSGRLSLIKLSTASSSSTIRLDAIKFNDADNSDELFSLISRSLIGAQNGTAATDYVQKNSGEEAIIEYRVGFA